MKKLKFLLLPLLLLPFLFFGSAKADNNLATLVYPSTGKKVVVTIGSLEAKIRMDYGYKLFKNGIDYKNLAGVGVITNYRTTLGASVTSSQTTIPVSSVKTNDGHTITMADIGSMGFLVLEPGGTNEEIISFTGISASTYTGVTRGLAYYGNNISSVPSNQHAHQSGATVIMSNVNYVYNQFVNLSDDQIIGGSKTFTGTTTTFINIPVSTSSALAITSPNQLVNKAYVDAQASTTSYWILNGGDIYRAAGGVGVGTSTLASTSFAIQPASSTNPITIYYSDGTYKTFNIDQYGNTSIKTLGTNYDNGALSVGTGYDGGTAIVVRANSATQTGDLEQWENSSGATTTVINNLGQLVSVATTSLATTTFSGPALGAVSNLYGDGSDGNVVLSASTTLTSDKYYNNLTVNSGVILNTGGYKIFVSNTLTNNGTISRNGNNGTNGGIGATTTPGTGGSALSSGTVYGSVAGVNGNNGVISGYSALGSAGLSGNNETSSIGVIGANGGKACGVSSTPCDTYALGGVAGTLATSTQGVRAFNYYLSMTEYINGSLNFLKGPSGSGSGAGGGDYGAATGGGGGGSGTPGGIVWIAAKNLINNNIISANGGSGGNGGNTSIIGGYAGGGGAGGSGGILVLIYSSITPGTLNVNAGTPGSGGTSPYGGSYYGFSAASSSPGIIYQFLN